MISGAPVPPTTSGLPSTGLTSSLKSTFAALLELLAQAVLELPAEGELLDQVLQRLVLVAVEVRVDRNRKRSVLRKVGQRGVERAPGVAIAPASCDQQGEQDQGDR